MRRFVGDHSAPFVLGSVFAFLIPSAAVSRLDDDIRLNGSVRDAMLLVPPLAHSADEDTEGAVDGCLHFESLAVRRGGDPLLTDEAESDD